MVSLVPTSYAIAFAILIGLALGAGYWGAGVLFKRPAPPEQITQNLKSASRASASSRVASPAVVHSPPRTASPTPAQEPLWRKNAVAYTPTNDGPMIAIVIDDMGLDRKRSRRMWEDEPAALTLSFMTYADALPAQTRAARTYGHELMLHVSMEPTSKNVDPGPHVLMRAMSDIQLKKMLDWGLGRFKGYVGINNHMGSRFTEDAHAMKVVLADLKSRGLLFLDSRTSAKTTAMQVAQTLGMTILERNVFLDNDNAPDKVLKQLERTETLARENGYAIAIGHPRDATIKVLKTWIPAAQARGLNIVPISAIMKRKLAER